MYHPPSVFLLLFKTPPSFLLFSLSFFSFFFYVMLYPLSLPPSLSPHLPFVMFFFSVKNPLTPSVSLTHFTTSPHFLFLLLSNLTVNFTSSFFFFFYPSTFFISFCENMLLDSVRYPQLTPFPFFSLQMR